MLVCSQEEADWVLFDVVEGNKGTTRRDVLVGLNSVFLNCIYLPCINKTALYFDVRDNISLLSNDSLLRISRTQYGPELFPYGLISSTEVLKHVLFLNKYSIKLFDKRNIGDQDPDYERWARCKQVYNGEISLAQHKISASHLKHVTVHELRHYQWSELKQGASFVMPALERLVDKGLHETLYVGLILWAMVLPNEVKRYMQRSDIWNWDYANEEDFFQRVKNKFSLRLKAVQNLVPLDLTPLFELEVLVNRGMGEVDWEKERFNRTEPNLAQIPKEFLTKILSDLFIRLRARGYKPPRIDWAKYWRNRWEWAPTGAYHSQYDEDMQYKAKERTLRNKVFALSRMPMVGAEHFLLRPPAMEAWSSVKYEWGKQRAIYGVDITNFVLSGFAMAGCEDVIAGSFPIGSSATEENVRKTVKEVLNNGVPYCFDFEDFNSQHSNEAMCEVLNTYGSVFSKDMHPHQLSALSWIREALHNVTVRGGDGIKYQTTATLLSGWRLTTFMNTVLNYAYTKYITRNSTIVATHNGDDVLAAVDSLKQVLDLQKNAKACNIRFQKMKCFLGATAEFLRIDHRNSKGSQYLPRAISTFVHGPTESTVPNDLRAAVQAIMTRRNELIERGAKSDVLNKMVYAQFKFLKKQWKQEDINLVDLANTHLALGGVTEIVADETQLNKYVTIDVRGDIDDHREDKMQEFPGTYDYAKMLTHTLIDKVYERKIQQQAVKAIFATSKFSKFGVMKIDNKPDILDRLNVSQYGMFRKSYQGIKLVLAKTYGIPLVSIKARDTKLVSRLREESDIVKAMHILL